MEKRSEAVPLDFLDRCRRRCRQSGATIFLIAANVGIFIWMWIDGVSPFSPGVEPLLRFGATSTELILQGEGYRLFTAIFVHVGLIHIAANMWCLWNLGLLGEMLLGPYGLVAVYVLTGVAGNLLSLAFSIYDRHNSIGAGASGAVFGIAGVMIVLLSQPNLPFPKAERLRIRKSVIFFAIMNLAIGGATLVVPVVRIDNFAHLGGFFVGLLLGLPLLSAMTRGRRVYFSRQILVFSLAAVTLGGFAGYAIGHAEQFFHSG